MNADPLFKRLLTVFFLDFLRLFCPEIADYIDPGSVEFIDKETFSEMLPRGRRELDLVVKVRVRGSAAFVVIHIEAQGPKRVDFVRRMFHYCARLDEKLGLPVYPIALLYDGPQRPQPDTYYVEFPGLEVLKFQFRAIQLNRLDWRQFLRTPNPVASALMAKMRIARGDRPRVKVQCLRMLATLKLDPGRSSLISAFMNKYLKLTGAELNVYNDEVDSLEPDEQEAVVQLTNEWIERGKAAGRQEGRQQGRQEGRQEGRHEGRQELLLELLRRRFRKLPANFPQRIGKLSIPQLVELAEVVVDSRTLADVKAWLAERA